ncbi:MAG: hypothetical protein FWD40_05245 [Treponema sp.]|nr:hypothetical protein [Treponema sp.]
MTAIILSSILAIFAHALFPAEVNDGDFDSIFVKALGFPVVATLYFLILFAHCTAVTIYFGNRSAIKISGVKIGFRFGLSFALIYMIGMQEIVVEASPVSYWGFDFVKYQFFMGLADALPVLFLCLIIGYINISKKEEHIYKNNILNNIIFIFIIAITILITRIIGYKTGIINNNFSQYPVPCIVWTLLFGFLLGFIYVYIEPFFKNMKYRNVNIIFLTIGINWIIFNSFIGLIFKGVMPQMLLRSTVDIVVLYFTVKTLEIIRIRKSTN